MWMWRNTVVRDFVDWLRNHNSSLEMKDKARFYGLDLYSMFTSADEVIKFLKQVDPKAADIAIEKYGTLEMYRGDEFQYARDVAFGFEPSREREVVEMLCLLLKRGSDYIKASGGFLEGDEMFYATQNARVVKDAEEYYRMGFRGGTVTWNLRDKHMVDTLQELIKMHQETWKQERPKAVIWAHNSHLGDSRAFERNVKSGKWNVGQLVRERFGLQNCYNVGFTTFSGTVMAAESWGAEAKVFELNQAETDTYEYLFHTTLPSDYALVLRSNSKTIQPDPALVKVLSTERQEKLIGVMYVKYRERPAHYQAVVLPKQFDFVIHCDVTSALIMSWPFSVFHIHHANKFFLSFC
jgi:erythromycin esterase-like protein